MEYYLGSITLFAINWAPDGFAACNGTLMPINQNQALYSLLGNNFGGSSGTTFGLPDLQGRVPVGFGQGPGMPSLQFALQFGRYAVALSQANLPAHTHDIAEHNSGQTVSANSSTTVNASDAQAGRPNPKDGYWAKSYSGSAITPSYDTNHDVTMASDAVQVATTASFNAGNLSATNTGGSQAFEIYPPSLALSYVICTQGIYPQRP